MQLQTVPRMRGRDVSRRRETLSWSQGTPRMRGRDVSQLLAVLPLVGVLPACAGAMLRDMAMHGGDRKSESRSHDVTLNALGINRMASHRWQTMAGPETGGVRSRPDPPDALYGPCSAPFLTGG